MLVEKQAERERERQKNVDRSTIRANYELLATVIFIYT